MHAVPRLLWAWTSTGTPLPSSAGVFTTQAFPATGMCEMGYVVPWPPRVEVHVLFPVPGWASVDVRGDAVHAAGIALRNSLQCDVQRDDVVVVASPTSEHLVTPHQAAAVVVGAMPEDVRAACALKVAEAIWNCGNIQGFVHAVLRPRDDAFQAPVYAASAWLQPQANVASLASHFSTMPVLEVDTAVRATPTWSTAVYGESPGVKTARVGGPSTFADLRHLGVAVGSPAISPERETVIYDRPGGVEDAEVVERVGLLLDVYRLVDSMHPTPLGEFLHSADTVRSPSRKGSA